MFTRFNGNVVPFADDATSTNRTVFGGTTQSDLIDDNLNTNFKKGWEIVGLNDNPTREDFNAMGYTLGALTAYLYEMGISEWNASQNYRANSRVTGSDGKIYKSLTGTTEIPNVNHNPTSDAVNWELEFKNFVTLTENQTIAGVKTFSSTISGSINGNAGTVTNGVYTTGNQTIAGVKTFSSNPISTATQSTAVNALTRKDYVDGLDSANVKLTGDQTVGGIKTFTSSPIVPTPTTDFQAATKKYVDSSALPIGTILNGYTIFSNCIVAFGGEFNRADYPKLWAYLQANPSLVKTQAEWTTQTTANGGICGFFSGGNGTTTFRVPNLDKAFLRPDSRGVGSYQEGSYLAGDPSVSDPVTITVANYDDNTALFRSRMNWDSLSTVSMGDQNLKFYSSIYGASGSYLSAPVLFGVARPKNIAVLPLIVAK